MLKVAFVGFGDLGRQILSFLQENYREIECVYFDDFMGNNPNCHCFYDYRKIELDDEFSYVVGLGYKHLALKSKILIELQEKGRKLLKFVHPSCYVSESAKIEDGVIIYPHSVIDHEVIIESGSVINNGCIVSHNSKIGRCCFLAPGVKLSGKCEIGKEVFLGTGTIAVNNIKVGRQVICGAGTVINRNVEDGQSCVGYPMKICHRPLNL